VAGGFRARSSEINIERLFLSVLLAVMFLIETAFPALLQNLDFLYGII